MRWKYFSIFRLHNFSPHSNVIVTIHSCWAFRYNDVIMSVMASQITSLTIVCSSDYSEMHIKENIKAPRHWPLWGKFTGDRWIPCTTQRASNAENVSIWWRHHALIIISYLALVCLFRQRPCGVTSVTIDQSGRSSKVVALFLQQTLVAI